MSILAFFFIVKTFIKGRVNKQEPESVKINNCTNEEGKGTVKALLAWREGILKEKSILPELGK